MCSWHPATIHCFLWAASRGGPGRRADRGDGAFVRRGRGTQGKQLDMEVQKTLALMSRVVDMGLETVDIAMERKRKKMKAAAAMRTAAVNVQMTAVDLRTAAVNLIMESLEEADHLRSGKASLIGEELLVTRVATPEPMSMKAMG